MYIVRTFQGCDQDFNNVEVVVHESLNPAGNKNMVRKEQILASPRVYKDIKTKAKTTAGCVTCKTQWLQIMINILFIFILCLSENVNQHVSCPCSAVMSGVIS